MTINNIPDVQSSFDKRQIPINRVGVKSLRVPFLIEDGKSGSQSTIANFEMTVALPDNQKGTHMSRFVQMVQNIPVQTLTTFKKFHQEMLQLLNAEEGTIIAQFPFFVNKPAPVSQIKSLVDYEVRLIIDGTAKNNQLWVEVTVPVTSLCPCSKEISKYGAHNQRSHIIIKALYDQDNPFSLIDLINVAEEGSSCPIWSTLKRPDEKYITERAYENPKFVEDIVRDVAGVLNQDPRILAYSLSSENFESIHNHSAYAVINFDKRG